jgi:hypothetical protein
VQSDLCGVDRRIVLVSEPPFAPPQPSTQHYTVILRRDGTARYSGRFGNRPKGAYKARIAQSDFVRFTRELTRMHYMRLRNDYLMMADVGSSTLSIIEGGRRKEITYAPHSYARTVPRDVMSLVKLERLIHAIMKRAHWVKVSTKKES